MAAIKPLSRIASKWAEVAGRSGPQYEEGVRNPRTSWQNATAAANASWKAGINQAVQQDRFAKGVSQSSDQYWQENAVAKGVSRYAEGVRLSQSNYEKGFAPYAEVIARTTLPARGPKGDPNNINRVAQMAKALHDAKMSRGAGR